MNRGPACAGKSNVTFSPWNGEEVFLCLKSCMNQTSLLARR